MKLRDIRSLIDAGLENAEATKLDGNRSQDWLIGYRMALTGLHMALDAFDGEAEPEGDGEPDIRMGEGL